MSCHVTKNTRCSEYKPIWIGRIICPATQKHSSIGSATLTYIPCFKKKLLKLLRNQNIISIFQNALMLLEMFSWWCIREACQRFIIGIWMKIRNVGLYLGPYCLRSINYLLLWLWDFNGIIFRSWCMGWILQVFF